MRHCPACNTAYPDHERFCSQDGALLETGAGGSKPPLPGTEIGAGLVGKDIGNYRIEEVVGKGGMGVVFLARHRLLDKQFALKMLHPGLAARGLLVDRFFREARSASKVRSRHMVEISDFGRTETGDCYFVMELLDGDDVLSVLRRGETITIDQARRWTLQACDALTAAHDAGIIHRDIKPANLFLAKGRAGEEGIIKVLDFGVAKLLDADENITRTGDAVGTPAYMAPEQAEGTQIDGRADIYSLGAVLYRLVTRSLPYPAPNLATLVRAQLTSTPRPPSELNPEVSESLAAVIMRALAQHREARFQTMTEFAEALRRADSTGDVPTLGDVRDASTASASVGEVLAPSSLGPTRSGTRTGLLATLALLLAAGVGGAVWLASGGGQTLGDGVAPEALVTAAPAAAASDQATAAPAPLASTKLDSVPAGAMVRRDDEALGVTPLEVPVDADWVVVTLILEGHQPAHVPLTPDTRELTVTLEPLPSKTRARLAKKKRPKETSTVGKSEATEKATTDVEKTVDLDAARPTLD